MLRRVTHRRRTPPSALLALVGTVLATAPMARAGTYEIHVCDGPTHSVLTSDEGWSSLLLGSDVTPDGSYGRVATQAPFQCDASLNSRSSLPGLGVYQGTAAPGSVATRSYTPANGHRIIALRGDVIASSGIYSFSRGFLRTAAGRNLVDTGATPSGDFGETPSTIDLSTDALGTDGQGGLTWGVRCPDQLPAPEDARGYCRGGIFALRATITVDDGRPAPAPAATPQPAPTPPPLTQSAADDLGPQVTIAARSRRSAVVLSGRSMGCSTVRVNLPNGRSVIAGVIDGAWRTTVRRRTGLYLARCSTARASLRLRR